MLEYVLVLGRWECLIRWSYCNWLFRFECLGLVSRSTWYRWWYLLHLLRYFGIQVLFMIVKHHFLRLVCKTVRLLHYGFIYALIINVGIVFVWYICLTFWSYGHSLVKCCAYLTRVVFLSRLESLPSRVESGVPQRISSQIILNDHLVLTDDPLFALWHNKIDFLLYLCWSLLNFWWWSNITRVH